MIIREPLPEWLKVKAPGSDEYFRVRSQVEKHRLNTVCRDARCPNIGECWGAGTATFMILGNVCTRGCQFCAVARGSPAGKDIDEPQRVAAAVKQLNLNYVVITSVSRDDLADGGAGMFAETIRRIHEARSGVYVEALIPDFLGNSASLEIVVKAGPLVVAHNIETVRRLYPAARNGSDYGRSLDLLRKAKSFGTSVKTKSSLMLGLGETEEEIRAVLNDLRRAEVDIATLGQYLQPEFKRLPVAKYYTPRQFEEYRDFAFSIGFKAVFSGPLVRSSYHAEKAASEGSRF
ncbi:MAG TPA: lipoyl synthase [Acidobacteriota bacterium]|nr:lipoyl synthase [Acidobacteriota bacterium]